MRGIAIAVLRSRAAWSSTCFRHEGGEKSEVATNQEVVSVMPEARGAAWYWWRRCPRGRPQLDDDEVDMAAGNEAVDTSRMCGSMVDTQWLSSSRLAPITDPSQQS